MQQRNTVLGGQLADRDSFRFDCLAQRQARFEVRIVLAILAIIVKAHRFAADVATQPLADLGKALAAIAVFTLHADARDEDSRHITFGNFGNCGFHVSVLAHLALLSKEEFGPLERVAIVPEFRREQRFLSFEVVENVVIILAFGEDLADVCE